MTCMLVANGSTARLVPTALSDLWQETVISRLINGFSIIINICVPAYIIITSEEKNPNKQIKVTGLSLGECFI